jgi:hypothetical protein
MIVDVIVLVVVNEAMIVVVLIANDVRVSSSPDAIRSGTLLVIGNTVVSILFDVVVVIVTVYFK